MTSGHAPLPLPGAMAPVRSTDEPAPSWIERLLRSPVVRSGYASLLVQLVGLVILALLTVEGPPRPRRLALVLDTGSGQDAAEDEGGEGGGAAGAVAIDPAPVDVAAVAATAPAAPEPDIVAPPVEAIAETLANATATVVQPIAHKPGRTMLPTGGAGTGDDPTNPFAARHGRGRGADPGPGARGRGASTASEAAVERGLAWLARHQAADGSWRFDLAECRCNGACRDPGTLGSTTASTGLALLPFLGAGHTHRAGPHQETVARGIYYLLSRARSTARGSDLCEGTMYGQGVATLALAEALGMTGDELLTAPVRDAVRFIETAQDLHGGGWRYLPGQAGDITVTAWQLVALKSSQLAGQEAPSPTIDGVRRFLDSVQSQQGAAYGYRTPAAKPSTSAIGLLCRLYTGWQPGDERLRRGLDQLVRGVPDPDAIYTNFYLSQALLQSEHPAWPRWNARHRDLLVARQGRAGHEAGSWSFADPDTAPGGRLAHTALAILTLEVYYRLLPIYHAEAVSRGF